VEAATDIITTLVQEHTSELVAYAASRVKDRQEADDLVQNTFIAAFKGLDNYKGDSSYRTWLFSILRNKITDHYRKFYRGKDQEISSDEYFDQNGSWLPDKAPSSLGEDEHLLDNPEFNTTLLNCREHLPEKQFAVLQMKYYDQLAAENICKELGISSTYYWQLIHRAKLQLRDCLQKSWTNE
jgi:RNA polymerase sigma-70 factor (TIGR02943 family)